VENWRRGKTGRGLGEVIPVTRVMEEIKNEGKKVQGRRGGIMRAERRRGLDARTKK